MTGLKLRISDAAGKVVRELTVPPGSNQPGIQTVCWDLRLDSIASVAGGGEGGGRGGRGRGGAGGPTTPTSPLPQVTSGYLPMNPCGAVPGGAGGGGFGGGGAPGMGPNVAPGTYSVALVAAGTVVDTKPLKVVFDPALTFTPQMATRYFAVTADLHAMQRRATIVANALGALYPQMTDIASKIDGRADIPASVKTQFAALNRDFNAIRPRFGVPASVVAPGAGRGGGGGRGGAVPADSMNVVSKVGTLKTQLASVWEIPSAALARQYSTLKLTLPRTIADGNAVLARVPAVSAALKKYGLVLTVGGLVE